MKFPDLLQLSLFMYRLSNNIIISSIQIESQSEPRIYATRSRNVPGIERYTTNLYNRSFFANASIVFTRLHENLKISNGIQAFLKKNYPI